MTGYPTRPIRGKVLGRQDGFIIYFHYTSGPIFLIRSIIYTCFIGAWEFNRSLALGNR